MPSRADHEIVIRAQRLRTQYVEANLCDAYEELQWFLALDFAKQEVIQGDNSVSRALLGAAGWSEHSAAQGGTGAGDTDTNLWFDSKRLGKSQGANIVVQDRETGRMVHEKIPAYIKTCMSMMYGGGIRASTLQLVNGKAILSKMTKSAEGYNKPDTVKNIPGFIKFHNLNMAESLHPVSHFKNFNEFFYRNLKPDVRPVCDPLDAGVAVMPADARCVAFPSIAQSTALWIKGEEFTLTSLFRNEELATEMEGGALMISRLAPQDYHRTHVPVTGTIRSVTELDGVFYTVNPVAVRSHIDVYSENRRNVVIIDSEGFGMVVCVIIGATMVGSIVMMCKEGDQVAKGDELAYFAFGGSTIVTVFPKDSIVFDRDITINSSIPVETLVKFGTSAGVSTANGPRSPR